MKSDIKKRCTTVGLIWIASLIVFGFVYMLFLEPQRQRRRDMSARLSECKKAYAAALVAAQEQTQARLAKQVGALESRLDDFVVDFDDSANLTFDISATALKHNIESFSITSLKEGGGSADTGFKDVAISRFNVSFTAEFNQFAAFLNALERHRPTIIVEGFTIARSGVPGRGHGAKLDLAVLVRRRQAASTRGL